MGKVLWKWFQSVDHAHAFKKTFRKIHLSEGRNRIFFNQKHRPLKIFCIFVLFVHMIILGPQVSGKESSSLSCLLPLLFTWKKSLMFHSNYLQKRHLERNVTLFSWKHKKGTKNRLIGVLCWISV